MLRVSLCPTWLTCLRAFVPTCLTFSHALRVCVPSSLCILVFFTCLSCLHFFTHLRCPYFFLALREFIFFTCLACLPFLSLLYLPSLFKVLPIFDVRYVPYIFLKDVEELITNHNKLEKARAK